MTLHIGLDIGSVHTHVLLHQRGTADEGGRLSMFRFATALSQALASLETAIKDSDADWSDVALLACGASAPEAWSWLTQGLSPALRQRGFRGCLCFMQPDASLSITPWADARSGPAAGMLAASVLGRLIGEPAVLAVDVGATGMRCALIREGQLVMAGAGVALEVLEAPGVAGLRRHCERAGQDPQACMLLAFGGGGAALAVELAVGLGCARAVVPMHAAAFAAWGLLQAELRFTHSLSRARGDAVDVLFEQLQGRVLREIAAAGLAEEDLRFARTHEPHRLGLSASTTVMRRWLPIQPSIQRLEGTPAPRGDGVIDTGQLQPGATFAGPLVLQDASRGLHLPAQASLTVDSYGNLVIEFAHEGAPHRSPGPRP